MRKTFLSTAAALALGFAAFTTPASAQVEDPISHLGFFEFSPGDFTPGSQLTAQIEFDKRVVVLEAVRKVKLVLILVGNYYLFNTGAESTVVTNQDSSDGTTDLNYPGGSDAVIAALGLVPFPGGFRIQPHHQLTATIDTSLNDNSGIVQFNQDGGVANNQGNTLSAAVAFNAQFAESMTSSQQTSSRNDFQSATPGFATNRFATITNSVNNNSGAVMVNQSVGAGGNQLNAVSLAVGRDGASVALSEADLGQFNTYNTVNDSNSHRAGLITGSFNGNQGIALGNQSTGNFVNQATTISIAGSVQ